MTLDDLRQWLTTYEWQAAFDGRTLMRARDYARRGHVLDHHIEDATDATCVLHGEVDGSKDTPYRTSITIEHHGRQLRLDTDCSCPVGTACKHAAALLFHVAGITQTVGRNTAHGKHELQHMLKAPPGNPSIAGVAPRHGAAKQAPLPPDWSHWLDTLERGVDTPVAAMATAAAGRRFALLLRTSEHLGRNLLVMPAWFRTGKTAKTADKLVDPQVLALDRCGPAPAPPGGWSTEDLSALAVLMGAPRIYEVGKNWWHVHAVHVETALRSLAARYPVLLQSADNARLTLGEPLSMQWGWEAASDGAQRLVARLADPDAMLVHGATLWYLAPARRQFGPVNAPASAAEAIGRLPELPPEHATLVRERLARVAPNLPLPAPRSAPRLVTAPPVPVLVVRTFEWYAQRDGTWTSPTCAHLYYDYAGNRIDATRDPYIVRRMHGDELLEIHRDQAMEGELEDSLVKARLTMVAPWSIHGSHFADAPATGDLVLGANYHMPSKHLRQWQPVLESLAGKGFRIEYAANCPHQELLAVEAWHGEIAPAGNAWFDVTLGIDVAGERLDLMPILRGLLRDPTFPLKAPPREKQAATWRIALSDTRAIELPLAKLRGLIEPLLEWLAQDESTLPRVPRSEVEALAATAVAWRGGDALRARLEQLKQRPRKTTAPRGLKATLRPYQLDGLAWLNFLGDAGLGGILADDMGLGKTVQVLAHILAQKQRGQLEAPVLVVCPTSLVGNWQAEARRFTPTLTVLALQGADRAQHFAAISRHDIVITTYPLLSRDEETLAAATFSLLVLDEAQAIKNAASQAASVVRKLHAERRLAMTGTPLENHLGELWAEMDAVEPGILDSARHFSRFYRTPIEKHGDADRQARLNRRIGALMLRRRKDDVLTDLPAKTEIVRTLELEAGQRALYEALRLAQHERVRQAVAERGLARSGIVVIDALLKLRQACCDPRLVKLASARKVKESAKLAVLVELLESLTSDDRRVLVFSQFTEMLALIEAALTKHKLPFQTLTGQTPARERTALVKRFQAGQVPVFLISLKAGGTGLNLTAADTVIHYDPWWNPAVEAQATDRAHRIGQDKPVFVYRLICKGTVEEKIQAMQGRKAELARAVLEGGSTAKLRFDQEDLDALFGGP